MYVEKQQQKSEQSKVFESKKKYGEEKNKDLDSDSFYKKKEKN